MKFESFQEFQNGSLEMEIASVSANDTKDTPDVQNFVGAISGKDGKGLFVTTAKFSKQASEYAKHQHIILIDGEKLGKLMIEHNFGVTVKKVFEIKSIDTDVFNEYLEG